MLGNLKCLSTYPGDMDPTATPRVDPSGRVQYPEGYVGTPRHYGFWTRTLVWTLLLTFVAVVVVTTGLSLGRYCLTSDAGDLRSLMPWLSLE